MPLTRTCFDRRELLQLGALASGLSLTGCARENLPPPDGTPLAMRYRPLGATGLQVSEVTCGTHGVDIGPLAQAAIDAGITTFFTSGSYLDGREEEALGGVMRTLGSRRDELVVITGTEVAPGATRARILAEIDASLRRLRTDRIEVYCAFQVRTPSDLQIGALFEAFEVARAAGKVRHLGMSGHHGGMQACLNTAIDDGRFGVLCTKYDFVSYPDQDAILHRAAQRGVGTIVFKTNAGNRHKEVKDLEAGGLSFRQATVRWALGNPDVASVAVTISNFDQIRGYAAAVAAPLTAAEAGMLRHYADEMADRYCRFCGTCEPSCPRGVAVADVMRFAMYFAYDGREKEAMRLYRGLPEDRRATGCAGCGGPCAAGCPFGRRVRDELVQADRWLRIEEA